MKDKAMGRLGLSGYRRSSAHYDPAVVLVLFLLLVIILLGWEYLMARAQPANPGPYWIPAPGIPWSYGYPGYPPPYWMG